MPLVLGVAYISPEGSPYSCSNTFIDVEQDFFNNILKYDHCMILGDFNAHTKTNADFDVIENRQISKMLHMHKKKSLNVS